MTLGSSLDYDGSIFPSTSDRGGTEWGQGTCRVRGSREQLRCTQLTWIPVQTNDPPEGAHEAIRGGRTLARCSATFVDSEVLKVW